MSSSTPTRRSGRQRIPSKKYSVDVLESLRSDSENDLKAFQDSGAGAAINDEDGHDESSADDEIFSEPVAEESDEMSAVEASDGSPVATPIDEDIEEIYASDIPQSLDGPKLSRKRQPSTQNKEVRSRGMTEPYVKPSRARDALFIQHVMGSDVNDQAYFRKARAKWANIVSLPRRYTDGHGEGGMDYPFNYSAEQRNMESTVGWDWYFDEGGKATLQTEQISESLTLTAGTKYVYRPNKPIQTLLLGPYGKQQLFTLSLMQSISLDESWNLARMNQSAQLNGPDQRMLRKRQTGWVLNVGTSVRCLEWAPNCHGKQQYLAVTTLPPNDGSKQPSPSAPAYTASPPTPSCIQLWVFTRSATSCEPLYRLPQLRTVICTEWGPIKDLKWCPMPRNDRAGGSDTKKHLGLLAGVWNDGYVRVLDIYLDEEQGSNTTYSKQSTWIHLIANRTTVKYKTAAFEARPPETLCTCVTWLSPTDIAVGCANGYLAVWNIFPSSPVADQDGLSRLAKRTEAKPGHFSYSKSALPSRPWLYISIHHSYVLTITSAYPPFPNFVCSASISGHTRLTDMRSPTSDSVYMTHVRIAPSQLSYCPHLNCFLSNSEDKFFVRAWPLRRFWSFVAVARIETEILSISATPLHPTVLCGCADGSLLAFNPLRRYLGAKFLGAQPQQIVWKHEWVRSKQTRQEDQSQSYGNARFTEGYKVDDLILHPDWERPNKGVKTAYQKEEVAPMSTIYEEQSGVRVISWNPNVEWGGWVATGLGSGLVRVEDLAI